MTLNLSLNLSYSALRRGAGLAVPLIAAVLLSSCASIIGPRQIEVPLAKLQQNLDKRFPQHHRVLAVFELELSHPALTIPGNNDRVALALDTSVTPLLARQSWNGVMGISGRLQIDLQRNAVFLADARIDRFAFDGLDEGRQRQITGVGNLLSDKMLKDVPVYSFKPDELRYAGVQFVPTRIATTPTALVLTLEPVK
ncbi:DUF1439 domain-containing protein [Oxalobacteraceae bacterium]|nr:DUF1439 domain-containing protein [Oxalobacteraceae bacterium]